MPHLSSPHCKEIDLYNLPFFKKSLKIILKYWKEYMHIVIKIVLGDTVKVALSPYDLTKGRVIFRTK